MASGVRIATLPSANLATIVGSDSSGRTRLEPTLAMLTRLIAASDILDSPGEDVLAPKNYLALDADGNLVRVSFDILTSYLNDLLTATGTDIANAVVAAQQAVTDAGTARTAAQTAATAAAGSATASDASKALAQLFATSPKGETFSDGDEAFLSARHYAETAADITTLITNIPKRNATTTELAANKVTLGTADLFNTVAVTNASGNVNVEVSPALWVQPAGDKEAWIRIRRAGAGTVTITSPSMPTSAVVLGIDSAKGRYTTTAKAAGAVTGTVRKFAGVQRRVLIYCWTSYNATDVSRNVTLTLSSGETLTKVGADTYTGANGVNCVMYSGALTDGDDADVTVTVTHGDQLWAWAVSMVTLGYAAGQELVFVGNSSTSKATQQRAITTADTLRLVVYASAAIGGTGSPATTDRGTILEASNTGGPALLKDIAWCVTAEQVAAAGTYSYTHTYLAASASHSSAIASILPGSHSAGMLRAPGGRVTIKEQNGVVTLVMPGDGAIYIEGDTV